MADKEEFPPLLSAGFYKMSLQELEKLLVSNFHLSSKRASLWKSLLFVYNTLMKLGIACDIWIDGSFLTEKIDPNDVDFVVDIPVSYSETGTADQVQFIENLSSQLYRKSDNLHSFILYGAPVRHPMHAITTIARRQWEKDFGHALISQKPKGIAVLEVTP